MQGGDLFDRLIEKKKFSESEAKIVFLQLLLGVKYLHDAGIAHRDLKVSFSSSSSSSSLLLSFFNSDFIPSLVAAGKCPDGEPERGFSRQDH